MFVKIFFTVNMFISIDYEVMINYVKEKISLHTLSKQTGKVYLKKQTKKSNKLKQATKWENERKKERGKMKHNKKTNKQNENTWWRLYAMNYQNWIAIATNN